MVKEHVLPDLLARSGEAAVIVSRSLKTWGQSESGLAEMIADRVDTQENPTIAFLARGIEGIVVRLTAKAATADAAWALIEPEEAKLREILGDLVFAVDDETMEHAVLQRLEARGWTLGVAESLTGGLIGARIANVPGASRTFQRFDRVVRDRREALGAGRDRGAGREPGVRGADGRGRAAGARRGRRHRGDRRRGPGRAGRPAGRDRLVRARAARACRSRRCRPGCPATVSASASSRRSRCSTSCGCASTPSRDIGRGAG